MARNPDPLTLSDLVRRAAEIVDPDDEDGVVGDFEQRFEDADEPVTSFETLEERIGFGADEDPAVVMAQAVVLYLAHRRDEVSDDDGDILSLAARAEFDGNPPQSVQDWLADRGVRV
jgi:arginine utilization protein RocB